MYVTPPPPSGSDSCPFLGSVSAVVDVLFIVYHIVCGGFAFGPCYVIHYFMPF